MSPLVQHILALAIVAVCGGYVGWQGLLALRGKRSRVGSCCAKGCPQPGEQGGSAESKPKIVYMPVSMLSKPRQTKTAEPVSRDV